MKWTILLGSIIYAVVGLLIFMVSYIVFDKLTPSWDFRKEIVENRNIAVGIIIAGMFIGLAIIIASAIK